MNLPEHEPRADLWMHIEAQLRFEEQLTRAIGDLPEHETGTVWSTIEACLQNNEQPGFDELNWKPGRKLYPGWSRAWSWAAAASVLLMLGVWAIQFTNDNERVTITYTTEVISAQRFAPMMESPSDAHLADFIREHCEQQVTACNTPVVKELKGQLDDLNFRKIELEQQRKRFGDDPDLVEAQIKVENQRADVIKELVRQLRI